MNANRKVEMEYRLNENEQQFSRIEILSTSSISL